MSESNINNPGAGFEMDKRSDVFILGINNPLLSDCISNIAEGSGVPLVEEINT
jgi:hypothetical protein